ncbi:MAG: Membrane-associated phospholipid phosphatase [Parcubacteria bacterium C7867-006]|nr:MAG: Membrane-associated phospholipid phosphatase [Parcubacteria bacterium C7867-006]
MEYIPVGQNNNMNFIDTSVQKYFSLARTAGLTEYMYIISNIFDVSFYSFIVFICITALVYLFRGVRYAILFFLTIVSTGVLVYLFKIFFNIARPTDGVFVAFGQSFPSYHATMATVFFVILMYIFDNYFSSFLRVIFNIICLTLVFTVSFSRIYLGVHWLSDVLFGMILGVFIVYFSVWVFRKSTASL